VDEQHQPRASSDVNDRADRDVVVVGGGQAGLAIGYFLAQQGRDFVILEASGEPAAAWRGRWDSLRLFTPVRYSSLPGMPFPGELDSYPGRDEVAAYLTEYARRFALPVQLRSRVRSIRRSDGRYVVELEDRTYSAAQVVIATGPFQVPFVPAFAARLGDEVVQLHSTAYRAPAAVPSGRVLVVGGGNTGFQIAKELSALREVHLAIGSRQKPLPQRTGLIRKSRDTRIGGRLEGRELLIGSSPRELRDRYGVKLRGRAVDASGRMVRFSDGSSLDVAGVIWATGFRHDFSFVDVPVFDETGRAVHRRGVTSSPGLYFLGLIGWVGDDAAYIAEQIKTFRPVAPAAGGVKPLRIG
jgi:putative flavoprotein involved in K+ transport